MNLQQLNASLDDQGMDDLEKMLEMIPIQNFDNLSVEYPPNARTFNDSLNDSILSMNQKNQQTYLEGSQLITDNINTELYNNSFQATFCNSQPIQNLA